jgi:hypothetical protein
VETTKGAGTLAEAACVASARASAPANNVTPWREQLAELRNRHATLKSVSFFTPAK